MKEQNPHLHDADLLLQKINEAIEQKKHGASTPADDVIDLTSSRKADGNLRVSLHGGDRSVKVAAQPQVTSEVDRGQGGRSEAERFQDYLRAQASAASTSHNVDVEEKRSEPTMRRAKMVDAVSTESEVRALIDASAHSKSYDVIRLRAMPLDFMLKCYLCREERFLKGVEALKLHRLREHDVDPETYSSYQCCRCSVAVTSALQLNAHLEVQHDLTIPVALIHRLMVRTDMEAFSEEAATKLLRSQVL